MGQGFWVRDKLMLAVGVAVLGVVGCGSVGVDGGISVEPTNASVRPAVESTVVPDSGEVRERLVSADWTLRSPCRLDLAFTDARVRTVPSVRDTR